MNPSRYLVISGISGTGVTAGLGSEAIELVEVVVEVVIDVVALVVARKVG